MKENSKISDAKIRAIKQLRDKWTKLTDIAAMLWVSLATAHKYQNYHPIKEDKTEDNEKNLMFKLMQKYWISHQEPKEEKRIEPYLDWCPNNVLVIWDIHAPWEIDWYLEFCRQQQEERDCWTVIFIWDLVDFHAISYHEHNADLMSPWDELASAKEHLRNWYHTFPMATVCVGNHDLLPKRKWATIWLAWCMIRWLNEIIWAPWTWNFVTEIELNWVLYTHWSSWDAFTKAKANRISTVQWHLHTKAWVQYQSWSRDTIFWMQVWCGIDAKKEAFEYGRSFKDSPIVSCWLVLNSGKTPLVQLM